MLWRWRRPALPADLLAMLGDGVCLLPRAQLAVLLAAAAPRWIVYEGFGGDALCLSAHGLRVDFPVYSQQL